MKNHHPASELILCIHIDGVDEHPADTSNRLDEDQLH